MLYTIELTPAQKVALTQTVEEKTVETLKRANAASDPGYVAMLEARARDYRAIIAALNDAEVG